MLVAWVSSELINNELHGWVIDTEDLKHREVVVSINGLSFCVLCNALRKSPKRYPLYKDFGFRLQLSSEVVSNFPESVSVSLKDKETQKVIYRTKLKVKKNYEQNDNSIQIQGKLNANFKNHRISGWLADKCSSSKRVALLVINDIKYQCVANKFSTQLEKQGIHNGFNGFALDLSINDILSLPAKFIVQLYDEETGRLLDKHEYKNPEYLIPNNFNEYLNYSTINPLVYAPYTENHKRCFAFMENVAGMLANENINSLCSVIMPVFNREQCVLESINSVLSQTYKNFELIIIDDGSTDSTSSILNSISDERVKILKNSSSKGVSFSRNLGLLNASGDYIFYLDSDNTWDERYLKVMMGAFSRLKNADAIYCGQYLYKNDYLGNYAVRFSSFNRSLLENRNYIDINCFGHKRKVLDTIKGFDESLKRLVDYDFVLKINSEYVIFSIPVLLSNYYTGKIANTITKKESLPRIKIPDIVFPNNSSSNLRKITAIVPNYESFDVLKDCITSLKNNNVDDIIVIDNGSSQDVTDKIHSLNKEISFKFIKNSKNYGYTYAINQGLKEVSAKGDILLINNDAYVCEGAVNWLMYHASQRNDVGILVPRQILKSGHNSILTHVPFADSAKDCDVNLSIQFKNIESVPLFSNGQNIELNFAPFFCVYIKKEVLASLDHLDGEHGRHYRSDRIFCDYVRNILGLKILYVSEASVYHNHQYSTNVLKDVNPSLYKTMFCHNLWEQDECVKQGFKLKIWQKEYNQKLNILENSGFFDKDYYMKLYSYDVLNSEKSALEHYMTEGWKKGFNPSKFFDTKLYLEENHDVSEMSVCPLVHYLCVGVKEGRRLPKVSSKQKSKNREQIIIGKTDDLLNADDIALISTSEYFDYKWYISKYLRDSSSLRSAAEHYLNEGWRKGCDPSEKFCTNLYLDLYKDVSSAGVCPLLHYLKTGIKEGRMVIPVFKELKNTGFGRFLFRKKQRNPLISVIVASYNYEKLIKQTLDSILEQSYKNYEVIIVDDGSDDNSISVIEEYLKYKNFFLYTHDGQVNKGLPATVQKGVEKSSGEFVAFCEADDYWDKDYLLEKVNYINSFSDANVIINDVTPFGKKDKVESVNRTIAFYKSVYNSSRTYIDAESFRQHNWILTFSSVMVKKDLLTTCDFLSVPRKANLDWWLWRQICLDNYIYFVNKKLTYWRLHDSYMESDNLLGRLDQEKFLASCDRILLHQSYTKAKSLLKYTDPSFSVRDGVAYKKDKKCSVQPSFSIILPTFNRAFCIKKSVDSILKQTYKNFELIIVDDGSTDNTEHLIKSTYSLELESGKIVYLKQDNLGVSKARNYGLKQANNQWITYIDSDNICSDLLLEIFAEAILKNHSSKAFYAKLVCYNSNKKIGVDFNLDNLLRENFIDLGVYCHDVVLYRQLGGFDENMTRLVDWELITRYSKQYTPKFIDKVVMLYNDTEDTSRITVNYDLYDNYCYYRKKHCSYPLVSTVITSFNHEKYIAEAIESAIVQVGAFRHEILISDDCSTDNTRKIIKSYADRYPNLIKDISSDSNLGISQNLKKCFSKSSGDYIAILEGDDYWIDKFKLQKQVAFLNKNDDCSMVFSRIKLLNNNKFTLLSRHNELPEKISGENILNEPTLNVIANFSCCMFRTHILKNLPDILFSNRFNEIALSFYIEKFGYIGFIKEVLSVYRIHDTGVWSSKSSSEKFESGLICRQTALSVCDVKYKERLKKIIKENYLIDKK